MIDVQYFLQVILFSCLIILIVALTIAIIKLIKVLGNVNDLVDDIQSKSDKLNGVFDITSNVTTAITAVSDKIGSFISDKVNALFKKGKDDIDE